MQRTSIKLQLQEQIYDAKSMLDEENFYNNREGKPDELSAKITWLLGSSDKMYPIATMAEGNIADYTKRSGEAILKKSVTKELDDMQYHYPVLSRTDKAVGIATNLYSTGDTPGLGNSYFVIPFTDNWIKRFHIIESPRLVQARVMADPVKRGDYWEYTCQLDPADAAEYCTLTELQAGTLWTDITTSSPESGSTGTEFRRVAPGKKKNQMSVIRHSHAWAGNAANKVMHYTIEADGKEIKGWMDWENFLFEREWLSKKENAYWYNRYNRQSDGTIAIKDLLTGKVIPRGAGILEQIPNYYTYSVLTYKKLQNTVRDALFSQGDTRGMSVTLLTGTGGIQEFNNALKQSGSVEVIPSNVILTGEKFISGSTPYNLALGGFYDRMYHIDGYDIKVKYNAIFDMGKRALKSPKHPQTGLPLESYRMVFIDDMDFDGEPNIVHVTQTGRSLIDGIVPGMTPMPKNFKSMAGGDNGTMFKATDKDESSYHRLSVCGVEIRRASRCIHLECVAGL